jgi:uncharacterized protein YlxP (DUF503 family)
MTVVVIRARFRLQDCSSLKMKRSVLQALKGKASSTFNLAIAETAFQDDPQRAELGVAMVAAEKALIEPVVDKLRNQFIFVSQDALTSFDVEWSVWEPEK